jgi:lysozyme family protein
MIENFESSLEKLLKSEGGFVNNPKDPGGITNLGVTKKTWEAYVGHPVSEADMRALTKKEVAPLYKHKYWDACNCNGLPTGVDYAVFDFAVNAGPGRSAKLLQEALGLTPDGLIGPTTLNHAATMNANELITRFSEEKRKYYESLPTFSTFGKGWLNRVAEVQTSAEMMVA